MCHTAKCSLNVCCECTLCCCILIQLDVCLYLCCWTWYLEKLRRTSLVALEGHRALSSLPGTRWLCCLPTAPSRPDAGDSQPMCLQPQVWTWKCFSSFLGQQLQLLTAQTHRGTCPGLLAGLAPIRKQAVVGTAGQRGSWLWDRTGLALRSWGLAPAPPAPAETALPAQCRAGPGVSHLSLALP